MTLPTNAPLPIGSGERLSGDVPIDGMLNQVTPLIPSELQHLPESHTTMDKLSREDWTQLMQYRKLYHQEEQAKQALEMLAVQKDSPSYGFRINNYRHSLQSATMVYRDGGDDEDVVVALFHDIGFVVCPDNHGEFSATMLENYVSEQNYWMLRNHAVFLNYHAQTHPTVDWNSREKLRGHPHFEYTANWVARYDQTSIQTQYDTAPLEFFEPIVHRVFNRPSKGNPTPS
ncbi:MAG: phosphohydrolase [SAR324 cluster bacterium]|jgi:predicted HD phosphohydrolase|nr:phosphohydrolase [SAR324 cluster bacterium]MDP7499397.1 phosphohydrolase [SAR324 cluster bacterium]|tara:strand:- start:1612 stop:2301 length:690 start_codon:yes stop_codon:yes gene_type:complete